MTRTRKRTAPETDEPALQTSSLIDICFLLLIYFLVTSQIVRKEQELSATIPGTETEFPPPGIAPVALQIASEGTISIRNESGLIEVIEADSGSHDLPRLTERLEMSQQAALISGQQAMAQIEVDGEAVQQRVTDVLNALAGVGITKVAFVGASDSVR